MTYSALKMMQQLNKQQYNLDNTVKIPSESKTPRNYGKLALKFIREDCEDLMFDKENKARVALKDLDGKSAGKNLIPFNMEKDLDRLCLEKAVARFLKSGSKEDAFDIYFIYCEIFKPFGSDKQSSSQLLKLLSEHESNASSLLMKHRDHYSHSVYVFIIGLAIYASSLEIKKAYQKRYDLNDDKQAACHFLKYWGLTSLFHDIGYPFEIAHQQMKTYVCLLDSENNNDDEGFAPYISYKAVDDFVKSAIGDLNEAFATWIYERLALGYQTPSSLEEIDFFNQLRKTLKDRAIHNNPNEKDYLYMDHAYFSGILLTKTYLANNPQITTKEALEKEMVDSICAILLHNSLFKFTIRSLLKTKKPLSLQDEQPLAYILMLCDELQCFDRTSYGQNSRSSIFAFDFDFEKKEDYVFTYYFDKTYEEMVANAKSYVQMSYGGYRKKSGVVREKRCKFIDDIAEIVQVKDVIKNYQEDLTKPDDSFCLKTSIVEKQKKRGVYLSDSNYINLYDFALALNGRYLGISTKEEMIKEFEENLSLEYKLSNILQAKEFARHLEKIGCFYTHRAVDYEPVVSFYQLIKCHGHQEDLKTLSILEHDRWIKEKIAMGWSYGTNHVNKIVKEDGTLKNDNSMREKTRLHHDLIDYNLLTEEEIAKDREPMELMLKLIKQFDGLTIYRMR